MCGILVQKGIISSNIFDAVNALKKRGPDLQSTLLIDDLFFGHSLLSMQGDNNYQPFYYGPIIGVFNGEIYNYQELLNSFGYTNPVASDSFALGILLSIKGLEILPKLNGEFSFVYFDKRDKVLRGARDRFGIKPLLYKFDQKTLTLASNIETMRFLFDPKIDHNILKNSLLTQYTGLGQTLYQDIKEIPPGYCFTFNNSLKIERWNFWPKRDKIVSQKEIREVLTQAIKERLNNKYLCLHLSGGLDSSIVAGISGLKNAYTVKWSRGDDESEIAKRTAQFLGINLQIIEANPINTWKKFAESVYYTGSTCINLHVSAKFLLNQKCSLDGHRGVLGGEGADEMFFGYPHFLEDLGHKNNNSSSMMRGVFWSEKDFDNNLIRQKFGSYPSWMKAKENLGQRVATCFKEQIDTQKTMFDFASTLDWTGEIIQDAVFTWSQSALSAYILRTIGDGSEMHYSLEGRLPFLDPKVSDIALSDIITQNDLIEANGLEKYKLRLAFKDNLTEEVFKRKKQAFIAPNYLTMELKENVKEILLDKSIDLPFFDRNILVNSMDALHESVVALALSSAVLLNPKKFL